MNVNDLIAEKHFTLINDGRNRDTDIAGCFCCDLLSIAVGKAPTGCAWFTVMANVNTLAVASLVEAACIILTEGCLPDAAVKEKAAEHGITVFSTELPTFDAALLVHNMLARHT